MKRKRWSEVEEVTLLNKYSHLQTSGTLAKLKTREKKFKPIAEHVNSLHHLRDPINFPFKWSWRDVSIKVQNMRHQYLGVKQKIRVPDTTDEFNWEDGDNHWENFMKYKQVFGDIELECSNYNYNNNNNNNCNNKRCIDDVFGDSEFLGFDELESNRYDDVDDEKEVSDDDDDDDDLDLVRVKKSRKGIGGRMLGLVSGQILELRDVVITREDKRREREWRREESGLEKTGDGNDGVRELELLEERREIDEERMRWRMKMEDRWEEEEMKWREKMVSMQMEHEKQMMQLHANACHNQMQILGVMARFFCQFFGSAAAANDGLLGNLVSQHHSVSGGLVDDNGKPDANSPSEFF